MRWFALLPVYFLSLGFVSAENNPLPNTGLNRVHALDASGLIEFDNGMFFKNDADRAAFVATLGVSGVSSVAGHTGAVTLANLGLVVGTNIQAYNANLTTYAGIAPSANVQNLLGSADYAAFRTALSLVVGANVQAYNANLTTYAGIAPSANVQTLLGATNFGVSARRFRWTM